MQAEHLLHIFKIVLDRRTNLGHLTALQCRLELELGLLGLARITIVGTHLAHQCMRNLMLDVTDLGMCGKILREILVTADRLLEVARPTLEIE